MNLLCGFYPRLAGQIYYTTKEIPFHRLTFTEPRDYRVVFFIQKQTAVLRPPFFLFFNSYRLSFFLSVTSGNKVLDVRCRQSPRRWRDFPPCPLRRRIYPTLTFR